MDKRKTKHSTAMNNPALSKAIDTNLTDILTATEGKEFAEAFVPFWKELIQDQDSEVAQVLLLHVTKMCISIEATVMQEFCKAGIKEIPLTELEVQKIKVFATRLQDKSDKDVAKYFELLRRFMSKMWEENIQEDDQIWQEIVAEIQRNSLKNANKLSHEQLTGSALGVLRSTATYYFEELATSSEPSVECDPIYSLPPGECMD